MKRLANFVVTFATVALMSSSAFAAIDFSDDFESYTLYGAGDDYQGDIGGGWLAYGAVFGAYVDGCPDFWYAYGDPFPAPNRATAFSNISLGSSGQALNAFTDYNNANQADGCVETSIFQETVFAAADVGTYSFKFDTQVPVTLGPDVSTYGFIKLLDPNNGYNTDIFETVSTATAGLKSITVTLDETADGKILQWGFTTRASLYQDSGRLYDNVTFALNDSGSYQGEEGVPIPLWAFILMGGLLALVGGSSLRRRKT
ncbi:MAG: hypothetical protein WBS20_00215 [Lysobacterales bacterium]